MTRSHYKTRQRDAVLACLRDVHGEHLTAQSLIDALHKQGHHASTATVYRTLDQLEADGLVRKFSAGGRRAACFEYIGELSCAEPACFHCICRECGTLIHLHCDELASLKQHIASHHGFLIDPRQTVFYGVCDACQKKAIHNSYTRA